MTDNLPQWDSTSSTTSVDPAFKVAALYCFAHLPDYRDLQEPLLDFCRQHQIRGTLLLAEEGINGTVAGSPKSIDALNDYLLNSNRLAGRLRGLDIKFSHASKPPFLRLKVRLKKEIVTLRAPEANPALRVGTYVQPHDWNDVMREADIIIDTRNDYEVAIGTFEGATDPKTKTFTEFKKYVEQNLTPRTHKKVAMFCTGGIRCEKASAYMLEKGYEQVWHLKGGILKYLEEVPEEESSWKGACFVFDDRVALEHGLNESDYTLCYACRRPITPQDKKHPDFIEGVQCHRCRDEKSPKARESLEMRQKQVELASKRGMHHLGDVAMSDGKKRKQEKEDYRLQMALKSQAGKNRAGS